jgi:hypothetical protein
MWDLNIKGKLQQMNKGFVVTKKDTRSREVKGHKELITFRIHSTKKDGFMIYTMSVEYGIVNRVCILVSWKQSHCDGQKKQAVQA